jgi:hypothetical protein
MQYVADRYVILMAARRAFDDAKQLKLEPRHGPALFRARWLSGQRTSLNNQRTGLGQNSSTLHDGCLASSSAGAVLEKRGQQRVTKRV